MADEKTTFTLDLDAKEFVSALEDAQGRLSVFGDAKNLQGLIGAFDKLLPLAGALGVAFVALKGSMDAVFEAERLKAINQQFEALTKNAGLSTETLRSGLEQAADGLIDTSDLLGVANKAIVAMGSSAEKLPEIMELARKAAALTGGDIKDTFEQITQAVSTGNLRMLKHMGIVVDADKAYQDFAKANGVAADALSESGKRQALLNEVLEKGNAALEGVDTNLMEATNSFQRMMTALKDLKEEFVLLFEKYVGPKLTEMINLSAQLAKNFRMWLGAGAKDVDYYRDKLKKLREEAAKPLEPATQKAQGDEGIVDREKIKQDEARFQKDLVAIRKERITEIAQLSQTEVEMNANYSNQKLLIEQDTEAKIQQIRASSALNAKQKAAEEFQVRQNLALQLQVIDNDRASKMSEFRMKRQEELLAMATNERQVEEILNREKDIQREQALQKEQLISQSEILDETQKAEQIAFINDQLAQRLADIDNRMYEAKKSALDNQVRVAQTASDQILLGFTNASKKAAIEAQNFTKVGEAAFNRFTQKVSDAFVQVGMGAKSLGEAMKEAILGALADEAIARGQVLIASSIFPPNPIGLAAGAGLLALGGVLKAAAGGGSSFSTGGSGGGVAGATATNQPTESTRPEAEAAQVPKKSVTIQVMGNYFETEQTKTRLTELIREASDATNFTIQQVGGGF